MNEPRVIYPAAASLCPFQHQSGNKITSPLHNKEGDILKSVHINRVSGQLQNPPRRKTVTKQLREGLVTQGRSVIVRYDSLVLIPKFRAQQDGQLDARLSVSASGG